MWKILGWGAGASEQEEKGTKGIKETDPQTEESSQERETGHSSVQASEPCRTRLACSGKGGSGSSPT